MTASTSTLRSALNRQHRKLGNWRAVGAKYGISHAMAHRIATSDYEPKDPHIRAQLGLPALVPAPACPKCGEVHVSKRCTKSSKPARRLWDMTPSALAKALINREEI